MGCTERYKGKYCQIERSICDPDPCQHGSQCKVLGDEGNGNLIATRTTKQRKEDYVCQRCPARYHGKNCHLIRQPKKRLSSLQAMLKVFQPNKHCQVLMRNICAQRKQVVQSRFRFLCKLCKEFVTQK